MQILEFGTNGIQGAVRGCFVCHLDRMTRDIFNTVEVGHSDDERIGCVKSGEAIRDEEVLISSMT